MKAYASIFFIFISFAVYSQEIVPKERFGEVELGITYEDVILRFMYLGLLPKNFLLIK